MMSALDQRLTDLAIDDFAIDAFALVQKYLYLKARSILFEFRQQNRSSASECMTGQLMEDEVEPEERIGFSVLEHLMKPDLQLDFEFEPLLDFQREIFLDLWRQCCTLWLLCKRVRRPWTVKHGYVDQQTREDIESWRLIRFIEERTYDEYLRAQVLGLPDDMVRLLEQHLVDELDQCLIARKLKLPADTVEQCSLKDLPTHPTTEAFNELAEGIGASPLDDAIHKARVNELLVDDPKRKRRVPSRFCSFHLDGFDLDEMSTTPLGPQYQPTDYASENARQKLASYSIDVVSIRVVKAGPSYTYPVEVYGKVIARDEIDYKCVYLFNRERMYAQTINSEKDMLALTGPSRALVTLGYMYFEFDLKIKDKDCPDGEVQFSKGVISYFCTADRKRIIRQLPSFQSTVKLVLQHVDRPVAASLQVSVVKQGHNDPLVDRIEAKITAGTTRNYRQHMVLYDSSSVCDRGLLRGDGSLVLNRNLLAVNGYVQDPMLEEKLALYVCFLDAGCEIEDEDWTYPAIEDADEDEDEDEDEGEDDDEDEEEQVEEDPRNFVTLKYPQRETFWEHGRVKLRVKVDWTAVLDGPEDTDFSYRFSCLPDGCEPNYRLDALACWIISNGY